MQQVKKPSSKILVYCHLGLVQTIQLTIWNFLNAYFYALWIECVSNMNLSYKENILNASEC